MSMSEMKVEARVRFRVGRFAGEEHLAVCEEMFGKPPMGLALYEQDENDGFTATFIDGVLFVDYILPKLDSCGFDLSLSEFALSNIVARYRHKFKHVFMPPYCLDVEDHSYTIKVLMFHSGGCSGLNEIA